MDFMRIDAGEATVVFDLRLPRQAAVAFLGPRLPAEAKLEDLTVLLEEGPRPSTADAPPRVSLCPAAGEGFQGTPGIVLADGALVRFELAAVREDAGGQVFVLEDLQAGVRLTQTWRAFEGSFLIKTRLDNIGVRTIGVARLAVVCLPLPAWAAQRLTFSGRWAGEFSQRALPIPDGSHEVASRGGRPGFENAAFLVLGGEGLSDFGGDALALHLAWSGNSFSLVERLGFGEGQIQIGERLEAGELSLAPGEGYDAPAAALVATGAGRNGLRQAFHRLAASVGAPLSGPRRVHFNSWEAVYFDFDIERLKTLAMEAAALGAERFVLDDGWFANRFSDRSGLGDWIPDLERFPDGLSPLIAHVESLGMDFGLWVEPEMTNPDSVLYRTHPDWVLAPPNGTAPTQRGQLVLDLSRQEVVEHLFDVLDQLLRDNKIAYLKWDHNRDLFPCSSPRRQTLGFLHLLDRLRAAHPNVEIESCASGGGRVDFGLMQRCARFWASDNTDAVERLAIQSSASLFLPLNRLGSHVGASPNPITGRKVSMAFRARIAMFAHMGIEADPGLLGATEKEILASHIALYKAHRTLIHGGRFLSSKGDDPGVTLWQCTAWDGAESLVLAARRDQAKALVSPPLRLSGLDPSRRYRISLIRPWPDPAWRFLPDAGAWRASVEASGALLMQVGMRLPLIHPETAWLVHLKAVEEHSS